MPQEDRQSAQVEAARASLNLAFKVLAQVGLLSLGVIIFALFGGMFLDRLLDTRPLFTVLLLVASFPASMYIIYRVALSAVAKIPPAAGTPSRAKEVHRSDDVDD
jgi:F0F1-type ATP synthase assembly protein I